MLYQGFSKVETAVKRMDFRPISFYKVNEYGWPSQLFLFSVFNTFQVSLN